MKLAVEPIPRAARAIKHLDRVVLRNLDIPYVRAPVDCFYTLSAEGERDPFYVSQIEEKTLNPSWDFIRRKDFAKAQAGVKLKQRVVIRVYRRRQLSDRPAGGSSGGGGGGGGGGSNPSTPNQHGAATPYTQAEALAYLKQAAADSKSLSSSSSSSSSSSDASGKLSTPKSAAAMPRASLRIVPQGLTTPARPGGGTGAHGGGGGGGGGSGFGGGRLMTAKDGTVLAVAESGEEDELLLESVIDLPSLERIHSVKAHTLPAVPLNALLFFFADGIYATKTVHQQFFFDKTKAAAAAAGGGGGGRDSILLSAANAKAVHDAFKDYAIDDDDDDDEKKVTGGATVAAGGGTRKVGGIAGPAKAGGPGGAGAAGASSSSQLQYAPSSLLAKKLDLNDMLTAMGRLAQQRVALKHADADTKVVSRALEIKVQLSSAPLDTLQRAAERTERRNRLKALCKQQQMLLEKERLRVAQLRRNNLPRAQLILAQTQKLLAQRAALEKARERLAVIRKTTLQSALDKLAARRRKLVSQLMKIYPIKAVPLSQAGTAAAGTAAAKAADAKSAAGGRDAALGAGGLAAGAAEPMVYTIRDIRLPSTNLINANTDDEQSSTALGYCGHLVLMLSKYLGVPLRYRIIYKSSRSDICDDVVQAASQFPLYLKGSDERRFQCGCILLNKNIEHMLNVRVPGWHAKHSQNTLENLEILLAHEVPR